MAAIYDQFDDPVGRLVIVKADGNDGNAFPVVSGDVYIGRDANCDIRIRKKCVSRQHAVLTVADDRVWVTNSSATNTTAVNGKSIKDHKCLRDQDQIFIGDRVFRFEYEPEFMAVPTPKKFSGASQWESSNSADATEFLDASMVSRVLGDASNAPSSARKQKQPTMETVTEEAAPKGLPTPVRAAINARRVASAKKSTGKKSAKQGVPTPLRQAINARRISYGSVAAEAPEESAKQSIPTPIRRAINARRASYGTSSAKKAPAAAQQDSAAPKGLPTPVRAAINARRVASAKKSTGKKSAKQGVPTPLRQAINARRISYGSVAADSVAQYDSAEEDDAAFAAAEEAAAAAATPGSAPRGVPTPLRRAINARRVSYTPGSGAGGVSVTLTQEPAEEEEEAAAPAAAPKGALPTPVRRSINARRVSYGANSVQLFSTTAPAAQATDFDAEEEEDDVQLDGVAAQPEQHNAALPTPVRAAINARRVSSASRRRSSGGAAPASAAKSVASSRRASAGSVHAAAGALFADDGEELMDVPTPTAGSVASRRRSSVGGRSVASAGAVSTPGSAVSARSSKSRRRSSVGSIPGSVYRWAAELQGPEDDWLSAVASTRSVPTVAGNQHMFFDAHGEMIKCLVEPWAAGAAGDVQPAMHTYFDEEGNEVQTVAVYADEIPAPAVHDASFQEEDEEEGDYSAEEEEEEDAEQYEEYGDYEEEEDAEVGVGPHSRFAHRGSFGMGPGEGRPNVRQVFSGTPGSVASRRRSSVGGRSVASAGAVSTPGSAVSARSSKSRRRSSVQSAGEHVYVPSPQFVDAIEASDDACAAAATLGVEAQDEAAPAQSPAAASVASGRSSVGGAKRRRSVASAPGSAFKAAAALYAEEEEDEDATDGEWESDMQAVAAAAAAEEEADEPETDVEEEEEVAEPTEYADAAAALDAEVAEGADRFEEEDGEEGDVELGNTLGQVDDEEYYGITHFTTDLATIAETDNEDASTVGTRTPGSALRRGRRASKTPARSAVKAAAAAAAAIAEEAEAEEEDEQVAAAEEEEVAVDFSSMKVAELRAECDARGIDNKGKKAELIARLESAASGEGAIETEAEEETAEEEEVAVDFSSMKVAELRAECDARGIDNKGKKAELIARLESAASGEGAIETEAEEKAAEEEEVAVDFSSMKVAELRAECDARGIDNKGKKAELIARLESAASGEGAIETEAEEEAAEEEVAVDFSSMKVAELRAECDARGIDNKGKKAELIARLESAATGAGAAAAAEEDFASMTYNELRALCKERGVDGKGKKAELIARLESA